MISGKTKKMSIFTLTDQNGPLKDNSDWPDSLSISQYGNA